MNKHDESWLKEKYEELYSTGAEQEFPTGYCFISLKLKRFRMYNMTYGRHMGDLLLDKVYEVISDWLAEDEYAAQIHLNTFNLLAKMPGDYDGILQRVVDLNKRIKDMPDIRFHGKVFSGMGIYPLPQIPVDFYMAQYYADICRSECKESAYRNSHFEVYGMTFNDCDLRNYDLQSRFYPAMENGELQVYLQPKVNLKTGEVSSAEALIRWISPEKGMLPMSDFLPDLEENGLIEELDLFVFEQVCQLIKKWNHIYGKKIHISVNLSASAFNYKHFFEKYKKVYEKYRCPKDCIEFELLESIVLNRVERVNTVVDQINAYGFSCALDDFGSGYSSFNVLANTSLSNLKIDRSLFRNEYDYRENTVVRYIIEAAQDLDLITVAEGVESWGYVDFLRKMGCDFIQGFIFYKPMPVMEFEERFLKKRERIDLEHIANHLSLEKMARK